MKKAQKLLKIIRETSTSSDGETPHNHPEEFDDNGVLTGLGPANSGPKHKHGISIDDQGNIKIKAAGSTDRDDPSHTHEPSDKAIGQAKDAFKKSFDKDAE